MIIREGCGVMPDYKALYFHLMRGISDAIELLMEAQRQAEEMYLSSEQAEIKYLEARKPEKESD